MLKKLANLCDVKSIITLVLTGIFSYLSVIGVIDAENFMSIFRLLIVFYFGTQVGKREAKELSQDEKEKIDNDK